MMRKLAVLTVLWFAIQATPARADVGLGAFIGEPTGLDVKLGLDHHRSSLDILLGWYSDWPHNVDGGAYGHLTYLLTPVIAHGESINVPVRLGIGGAIYDTGGHFNDNIHLAARLPLEIGLAFRHTPIEIYFEVALKITVWQDFRDHPTVDLDGGLGIRFYL